MKSYPYLSVGWFWYVGTLVPVIGILQVGAVAMADRFTYIPMIGLFLMITWGAPQIVRKWPYHKLVLAMAAGSVLISCMILTIFQVKHWKNSMTVFGHAVKVTSNNYLAHHNLAIALTEQGNLGKAVDHYKEAVRIRPGYAKAHNELGMALARQGKFKEAVGHHLKAVKIKPRHGDYHHNLAVTYARQGKLQEAIAHYKKALGINADFSAAHSNLGYLLFQQGRFREAIKHYQEVLRIRPNYPQAHFYMGLAYHSMGDRASALKSHEMLRGMNSALARQLLIRITEKEQ